MCVLPWCGFPGPSESAATRFDHTLPTSTRGGRSLRSRPAALLRGLEQRDLVCGLVRVEVVAQCEIALFEHVLRGVADDLELIARSLQHAEAAGVRDELLPVRQAELQRVGHVDVGQAQ